MGRCSIARRFIAGQTPIARRQIAPPPIPSLSNAGPHDELYTALTLTRDFQFVDDPQSARVFVLNGVIPDAEAIASRVQSGAGLLLILGPQLDAAAVELLLGHPVSLEPRDDPVSLVAAQDQLDPIIDGIAWNSAPQVRQRFQLLSPSASLTPLVLSYEDQNLILGATLVGQGGTYLLTPFLGPDNPIGQDEGRCDHADERYGGPLTQVRPPR